MRKMLLKKWRSAWSRSKIQNAASSFGWRIMDFKEFLWDDGSMKNCFLTLQILPCSLICLLCSMFSPGQSTNTSSPLWKEWEYVYLSKRWKHRSSRENDSHRTKVQPWRNTAAAAAAKTVNDWTAWACAYLRVSKDPKAVCVWGKVRTNPDGLYKCLKKEGVFGALRGIKRESCSPKTANSMIQEIPQRHKVVWGAERLHV